jgi:hypothetical protein
MTPIATLSLTLAAVRGIAAAAVMISTTAVSTTQASAFGTR